jgi:hypothetical protein
VAVQALSDSRISLREGPAQRAKVEPTIVAGIGIPTPDWTWGLTSQGDGMVTARSAFLPGSEYVLTQDPVDEDLDRVFSLKFNHGAIMSEATVMQFVGDVLSRPDPASGSAGPAAEGSPTPG